MQHPQLTRKLNDWEFERRFNRAFVPLALTQLLPLLAFAGITYLDTGSLSGAAVAVASAAFAVQVSLLSWYSRRNAVHAMRREGLVDEAYRPPAF
jgi:O-antigen/teichoic acid export membrane protein